MTNEVKLNIINGVKGLRTQFNKIASESDECFAYLRMYKTILTFGEVCRLLNIYTALAEHKDLLNWYKAAYKRSDKLMFREYLDYKNGNE